MANLAKRLKLRCGAIWLAAFMFSGYAYSQTVAEQYLLEAVNEARATHQLPSLHLDSSLSRAARLHALQMAARSDVEHRLRGEAPLAARAASAGTNFTRITENVGEAASAPLLHDLWMRSFAHRANLLDPSADTIGIAVVARGGQLYGVEDFVHAIQHLSLDQQEESVIGLLTTRGLDHVRHGQDARQTCALSTGYAGGRKPWYVMRYTSSDLGRMPEQLEARLATGKYREAAVGACASPPSSFSGYTLAILLYP